MTYGTSQHPYTTFVGSSQTHLGFATLAEAERELEQRFESGDKDTFVIMYHGGRDPDGNDAQYFHHTDKRWVRTNAGLHGARRLAAQS